uniref:NADH dehydrogenase subunit 6 n=1 Tax=Bothriocroton undatum TaxID=65642 RepID=H9M746_9ACAR|nr:NADH dehydrogenase subunit 6 [Bothriocroton undatum]AET63063.1 NADH dehydrogenase subunit 6 [Bothriocroton undatum]
MKLFLILVTILLTMNHPMTMLLSVMALVFFLSMIMYFMTQIAFISMIMILLILGGMLIIFMYMISLCPNKKIFLSKKIMTFSMIFSIFMLKIPFMMMNIEMFLLQKIFIYNNMNMLLLLMMYLIMSLMVVMKISKLNSNPLKMIILTYDKQNN